MRRAVERSLAQGGEGGGAPPRRTPRSAHLLFIAGCCLAVLGGFVPLAQALETSLVANCGGCEFLRTDEGELVRQDASGGSCVPADCKANL